MNENQQINRIGWLAIQHKEGWWVGNDKGVFCFNPSEPQLAKAALTIVWQRDGGKQLNFRIATFTGADTKAGEYIPLKSGEQAMKDYEAQAKFEK